MTAAPDTLDDLIRRLKGQPPTPPPTGDEPWASLIARISVPSLTHPVGKDVFFYFLEVLPPRWMGRGGFAFGEGADPIRLFWSLPGRAGFRVCQLTNDESDLFCHLAGIGRTSG